MKAIIQPKYGSPDILGIGEVQIPTPIANEVRVKIRATSVSAADTMIRRGTPFYGRMFIGLRRPKHRIPGTCFSGVVESLGNEVTDWTVGDEVLGEAGLSFGAHAEYVCVPADGLLVRKPAHLSDVEAAPICDGVLTSFNFLTRVVTVQGRQKVLINGAAGSLGTAAVQLAQHFGAEVTGVCSRNHFELVKSLGADHVVDYKQDDFTKGGQLYDIIFDAVGKRSYGHCKRALVKDGTYLSPVLGMRLLLQMLWTSRFSRRKAKFSATGLLPIPDQRAMLYELIKLVDVGTVKTIVDQTCSFDQIIEAHRYVDRGHKAGNVVIDMTG